MLTFMIRISIIKIIVEYIFIINLFRNTLLSINLMNLFLLGLKLEYNCTFFNYRSGST